MRRISQITVVLALCVLLGVYLAAQVRGGASGTMERVLVSSGRSLRQWDDRVVSMERERQMRLRTVQADSLIPGRLHERLDQYYRGVRVVGGEVVRETDGRLTLSVTASVYQGIDVDTTPTLSPEQVIKIYQRETGAAPEARLTPELVVFPRNDATFALAYRLSAFLGNQAPVLFVNAHTGAVEWRYDNLKFQKASALVGSGILASQGLVPGDQKKVACASQNGSYLAWDLVRPTTFKTYDLKGNLTRAKLLFDGLTPISQAELATNTDATWTDPVVVDAHTYTGWTYDYFYTRHAWKGLNNQDSRPLHIFVHPANRSDFTKYSASDQDTYFMNAFYCGQCGYGFEDMLMLGEGLPPSYYATSMGGQTVDYQAAALDVVAHEYAHAITDYTSALVYANESGALNEAFSDVMSVGAEFFQQSAGSGLLKADYLEGEDAWRAKFSGSLSGLRSLSDPAAYGDPDHYSKRYVGTDDNGGVHSNSSIVNHAFYLAIEGGTNRTSKLSVTGVGAANRDKIEKVFFRAFTTLISNATFSLARAKTIQAAQALYGTGSSAEVALTQAWNAVGVF